jgi:hypothetical protein
MLGIPFLSSTDVQLVCAIFGIYFTFSRINLTQSHPNNLIFAFAEITLSVDWVIEDGSLNWGK